MRRIAVGLLVALAVVACDDPLAPPVQTPQNLGYELEPSGDPDLPLGILLFWDAVQDGNLEVYRIYSRPDNAAGFGLRGETTSNTFHDGGQPDLEYYVVSVNVDGVESPPSDAVVVDERLRLESPASLLSTSLDGAIHLAWADNAFTTAPEGFKQYRVYSAAYSLDDNLCDEFWSLEGTTVAPEFLAGVLENGQPRCFGVSAESIEGFESLWSPIRADTPRPDARNVIMTALEFRTDSAGFRFFEDLNNDGLAGPNELGRVVSATGTDIDFLVTRDANDNFFLLPIRAGTTVAPYGSGPIDDLTSIDVAPETGFSPAAIPALPLYGYVFEMDGGDGFARFGGVHVTHVGTNYMIFSWSYQTDPGNPELSVGGGIFTAGDTGIIVKRK
jgi:hypothetical protein